MTKYSVWTAIAMLTAVLAWAGCSSEGGTNQPLNDILDVQDTQAREVAEEVKQDLPNFDAIDIPRLDNFEYIPQPGEFGYECTTNTDCDSGFCVPTPDGAKCSRECVEDCPDGWLCVAGGTGPDIVYICVPRFLTLCNPCRTNDDCSPEEFESTTLDLCLASEDGSGKFCGADCSIDPEVCPEGYVCDDIQTPGGTFQQCIPEEDDCTCTEYAIQQELSTVCSVENEFGTCEGTRVCTLDGLSACDAATPIEERG